MANKSINSLKFGDTYIFTIPYGTCSTAAGTAAKAVTVDNFSLETGAKVAVKFTVANTAASPTLNVNGIGAKAIYYNGTAITKDYLKANKVYEFIYNGTQWDFIGDINTDTDTKVTSVGNHYTPSANEGSKLSAAAVGTSAATWNSTSMVTGVTLNRDAKGHVTGLSVDSIKMPANPDTNTSHSHSAGVGLVGSGSSGTSGGTYTYKAKLKSETALTNDSTAATETSGRIYPVAVDKSGYLAVNVPWTDANTTYSAGDGLSLNGTTFSHKDTSSQASVSASGRKYITGVTLDTYGHVTGLTTGTETVADTNTTYDLSAPASKGNGSVSIDLTAGGSGSGTDSVMIKGSGYTTVTTDATKVITVNTSVTAADLGLSAAMKFLGTSTTAITDGGAEKPTVGGSSITPVAGNVVLYGNQEFVYNSSSKWELLGDEGSYALKTTSISAGAELTGGGDLSAARTIAHAEKGPASGYTSGNTTTSISGSGASATIKIPQLTVNKYGHVTSASDESITITMPTLPTIPSLSGGTSAANDTKVIGGVTVSGHTVTANQKTLTAGTNISITGGTDKVTFNVPTASSTTAGATIVYTADKCTTYTSDSGTCTPLAVQNAAKKFAIIRPTSSTTDAIVRYSNTTGDVKDSTIKIEDVTNTKDTTQNAQVISIPAANGTKKMVYGYCTDQVDGTSFIGGLFDASATEFPYASGLAIGGSSGNLLWKGNKVTVSSDIPTSLKNPNSLTVKGNGTQSFTYDGSSAKTLNIKSGTGTSVTSNTSGNITINHSNSVTAGTAQGDATKTLTFGGTFTIPTVTYDAQGHITGKGTTTMTMPANPNVDTKVTNTLSTTSKFYLTGTTSSTTTTGTQVFRTDVYVDANGNITANKIYNAVWNDYAEFFPRGEETEAGDIIALDLNSDNEVYVKATKDNKAVVGVESNEYGHILGGDNCSIEENMKNYIPVGLAGRVWVKVQGNPKKGDYIGASDIPGVGEVCDDKYNAIGICVDNNLKDGKCRIKII